MRNSPKTAPALARLRDRPCSEFLRVCYPQKAEIHQTRRATGPKPSGAILEPVPMVPRGPGLLRYKWETWDSGYIRPR